MAKLSVKVCVGTTCFVMGGSELMELKDIIPARYKDKVDLSGIPCLELCSKQGEFSQAPYVTVGDEVVTQATVDKVLALIDKKLGEQ